MPRVVCTTDRLSGPGDNARAEPRRQPDSKRIGRPEGSEVGDVARAGNLNGWRIPGRERRFHDASRRGTGPFAGTAKEGRRGRGKAQLHERPTQQSTTLGAEHTG